MSELGGRIGGHERLIRKLESISQLGEADKIDIRSLSLTIKALNATQDIVREGDRPTQCCVVIEGLVHRYKLLSNGKRQIVSFHIPGDMPDLQSLHLGTMDHSLGAIAPSEVALVPHTEIHALLRDNPAVSGALWRDSLIDASISREWIANIGARPASRRIAHLFCELYVRLRAVGLTESNSFMFPMTQSDIGDAMGLSTVHVNRSIQYLRALQLIALRDRRLHVLEWRGLQQEAMFDPAYLHLADYNKRHA